MRQEIIFLLVLGLANLLTATELSLDNVSQSEVKEIEEEIEKGNVPSDFTPSDKAKRGVSKLTNADTPSFNHLTSSQASGNANIKSTANGGQTPYRYVYNNQYYQSSPYISYVQSPQATQIASQYTFQQSPVAHYLQTPTQIQYVSTPSLATRYQAVNTKVAGATAAAISGTGSGATTQYHISPAQQLYVAPQSLYQAQTSGSAAHTSSSTSSSTSSPLYQSPQQLYYHQQQPIVMLLVQQQPNPAAVLYPIHNQQHQTAYVLGQNPFLNIYGNHRFTLPYSAIPNSQVTYLVPMAVQTTSSQSATAAKAASDKTTSNIQSSSSGVSYGVRTTKA